MTEPETKNKRKKNIFLILIFLLILISAAIIYLWLTYKKGIPQPAVLLNENVNLPVALPTILPSAPATYNLPNAGALADLQAEGIQRINTEEQRSALFTASAFTERFGSFSNYSGYKNFDELDVFMTDSMKKWVNQYKSDLQKAHPETDSYYALQTKAISSQVKLLDEKAGKSEILIKTQRQEFQNEMTNPKIFYQDILLKLEKVDDEWKVDGAYWQ